MRRKWTALMLAALLALALTACGEDREHTNRPDTEDDVTGGVTDSSGTGADADGNGEVADDAVNGSDGTKGRSRKTYGSYRDNGNDQAFNQNGGSTFGRVGEELQREAKQPDTVYDTMTGNADGMATWRQMLENGFVHDSDGFLLDGENAHWS